MKNTKIKSKKQKGPGLPPSKEEKLFQNLYKITEQYISGKGYKPLTKEQLMNRLSLPEQHQELFYRILETMVNEGHVEIVDDTFIWKRSKANIVSGTLSVHPRGFGFLKADNPTLFPEDIFVPKHLTMNAVDGDKVEVMVNTEIVSEKGPEGKVVTILSRSRTHIAGIILENRYTSEILAYVPLLGMSQKVVVQPHPQHDLKAGDRIVMEVLDWGSKDSETICRMSRYIGHISDPSCDIKAAIEEYELASGFPQKVLEEALSIGNKVSKKDMVGRTDFRQVECFTIDPDTAKDYDDAVSLYQDKNGHYHLAVHIADVSHYVKKGSALDEEAKHRCNSTYFPGVCIPMLPGELSNNLCSLKANVIRLTASVLIEFDADGNMVNYSIARSMIKSAKRFTYKEAKQVLDGKKKSKHAPTLKLMVELCGLLKKKRYERGSIEFAMPELVVIVDAQGVPQKMDYVEYDITHQLIEEFMLKANEVVATHLTNLGKSLTYRIHDEPAEENMKEFAMLAQAFGFDLPATPNSSDLQSLFDEALHTSYGQYLATSYIRRMRLAIYSAENIGHYGLGLTHYCHFTSPIRRYVDLVVHRILFGESDDAKEHLDIIALQCSEQERISAKAEQSVVLLKKLRLLDSINQKEPRRLYEAVVTRVKPFGIFFEVLEFMLEGFLHVSELEDDYFVYDDQGAQLVGSYKGGTYVSGDKVTVMLKSIDFIKQESHWNLVESSNSTKREKKKTKSQNKIKSTQSNKIKKAKKKRK